MKAGTVYVYPFGIIRVIVCSDEKKVCGNDYCKWHDKIGRIDHCNFFMMPVYKCTEHCNKITGEPIKGET